jgi:hypothetical protein
VHIAGWSVFAILPQAFKKDSLCISCVQTDIPRGGVVALGAP